jgi:hypothetical protein
MSIGGEEIFSALRNKLVTMFRKNTCASHPDTRKPFAVKSPAASAASTAMDQLAVMGGFSNQVSMVLTGFPTDQKGELSSLIHAKMCAHARSIGAIYKSSMFDHSAIFSIARMIVEAMTMFYYIQENVIEEEWEFRYLVLRIHDTTCRIKLFRSYQDNDGYADLVSQRDKILNDIRQHSLFSLYEKQTKDRILSGEEVFIGGMRRYAEKSGWDEKVFTGVYAYLSSHVHSYPMSYFMNSKYSIDYFAPSDFQLGISGFAIEIAAACVRRVTIFQLDKHLEQHPELLKEFSEEFLEKIREDDAGCTIFQLKASS